MSLAPSRPLTIAALTLAGLLGLSTAQADAGHDHGVAAPNTSSPGLPRFAATSDLFELVGVVNGRQLTLYLDRSADNSPVNATQLELEIGGNKVDIRRRADGEFEATLAQPLTAGTVPVTATVVAGTETDLLAGQFVVTDEAHAEAPPARSWKQLAGWAATGLALLAALAWLGRRAWGRGAARSGGAA